MLPQYIDLVKQKILYIEIKALKLTGSIPDSYDDYLFMFFIHTVNNSIISNEKLAITPVGIYSRFSLWKTVGHIFQRKDFFFYFLHQP